MIAVQIHNRTRATAAELAQLIWQTDLFGTPAKPPVPLQSRTNVRSQYALAEEGASAPAGLPPWRQRARQEAPPLQPEQPSPVHPLHRYAAPPATASEQDHHELQPDRAKQPADPSRYDDVLYGPIQSVEPEKAGDPAYPDDPYRRIIELRRTSLQRGDALCWSAGNSPVPRPLAAHLRWV